MYGEGRNASMALRSAELRGAEVLERLGLLQGRNFGKVVVRVSGKRDKQTTIGRLTIRNS